MADAIDSGGTAASAADAAPDALRAPSLRRRMACWVYEGMLLFAVAFFATWLFSTLIIHCWNNWQVNSLR